MTQKDLTYHLDLPDSAPQCRTLHANLSELKLSETISEEEIEEETMMNQEIALDSLKRIYFKYIDPSEAVLQVNISYRTRRQLEAVFKPGSKDEPIPFDRAMALLENAVIEISKVLHTLLIQLGVALSLSSNLTIIVF